jgi:hypothetical protein
VNNNLITGYPDGSFRGELNITRQEAVVLIYRYNAFMGFDLSFDDNGSLANFSDADTIGTGAAEAMKWAISTGLVNGDDHGKINPANNITRAEMAQLFKNYMEM